MKKYIAAAALIVLLLSGTAMAASPDAAAFSGEQDIAGKWVDTMLVKRDSSAVLKLMAGDAQKEIDKAKLNTLSGDIASRLGQLKERRFVSWTRFDQADQMIYLMTFEKEPAVRCALLFDKKGQLQNFALTPLKEKAEKPAAKKK